MEFLDTNRDADNWFLQIECFDPHEPFFAPERFREHYKTNYSGPILDWPRYERVTEPADEVAELRASRLERGGRIVERLAETVEDGALRRHAH